MYSWTFHIYCALLLLLLFYRYVSVFVSARTFVCSLVCTYNHQFICAYIHLCENMQVYARGTIVYWLEVTYHCVLFESVLFFAYL